VLLPAARDYKRAYDGDHGPNTGGMGAYAPSAAVDPARERALAERVVAPVLAEMERRGTPFRGLLYGGVMLAAGEARVVEFNVRFGDPETQVVAPLLEGSLTRLLAGAARGQLDPGAVSRAPGHAVAVALSDEGYPEAVRGGGVITGLEAAARAGKLRELPGFGEKLEAKVLSALAVADQASGRMLLGWRCRHDIAALATAAAAGGAR